MQANPVLSETIRGNWVENIHRGAFCFVRSNGDILAAEGDIERAIFPRSAIKSMQALPIFRTGAVDKFDLTAQEIAIACASHNGEPAHVEVVAAFLEKIGFSADDLECGSHPPVGEKARKELRAKGEAPSALHNNCSGKHAGMLAVAKAMGVNSKGYVTREHPVQQLVRQCIETAIEAELTPGKCGTDGCSIPTWAAPLKSFATGFARMTTGEGLAEDDAAAFRHIFDAATSNPFLVRGTDTLDTDLMQAFNGKLMIKIGAEGVFCGAFRDQGIGFALKIDDGNRIAAEVAIANLLIKHANPSAEEKAALDRFATFKMQNWRKISVGETRGAELIL